GGDINQPGQLAFWVSTDAGSQAVVEATPQRTPLLILPGIGGTFFNSSDSSLLAWVLQRGIDPTQLQVDPLANTYDGLIQTLENAGYQMGVDLFVANYDWRMPPAQLNPAGSLLPITAQSVVNGVAAGRYESGVDYLGYWLEQAAAAWAAHHGGAALPAVDLIAHSTGGLVARSYIQSGAYGGTAGSMRLPTVNNLLMLAVPNQGGSLAFNLTF